MRQYAANKQTRAAHTLPGGRVANSGMSNQTMLTLLSGSQKQRVAEEDAIRQRLNEKFGVDFNNLRVTKDAALRDIQERAYTKGNEIHLAPDVNPASLEGERILMHEAAHVIQQGTRSLSGGVLQDSSLEAQANAISMGAGHIDVSGFSMPTAEGAPVQGFFGFFNRLKANKLNEQRKQQVSGGAPEFARAMGEKLAEHGIGGTAVFDPQKHAALFKQGSGSEDGLLTREGKTDKVSAGRLQRELVGLPRERQAPDSDVMTLHGISQEELDGLSQLDPGAYRRLIEKSNLGASVAAKMDWTGMSDKDFLKNYTLLKALSRLNVVATQASEAVGIDKQLEKVPANKDLMAEHNDAALMMGQLMTYADARLQGISGDKTQAEVAANSAKAAQHFQNVYKKNQGARTLEMAKKLVEQAGTPELGRAAGQRLAEYGLGGTATFDTDKHNAAFRQAAGTEDGTYFNPYSNKKIAADKLKRELISLPREMEPGNTKAMTLHGISQEELDGISRLDRGAFGSFIGRNNRGANVAANMDWTKMSDDEFVKNYSLLKGLSGLNVVATQASALVGADKDLEKSSAQNKNLIAELDDSSKMMYALSGYAENRLQGIAGSEGHANAASEMLKGVQKQQATFKKRHAVRDFFTRLFGRGGR